MLSLDDAVTDDDDTERGRRRMSAQDQLMLESARRRSFVYPVPESDGPRKETAPWDLIDREELTPREQEVIQRSKRSSSDHATVADIVKVALRATKADDRDRDAEAKNDADMAELRATVRDLKRDASTVKWIGRGLLAAALTVFLYTADRILTRVEHEGETTIKMQHLETTVEELRQDNRSLRSQLIKGYQP